MNFATRWFGLMMTTALLVGGVAAEELPLPDPDSLELPDDAMFPWDVADELPPGPSMEPSRLIAPPRIAPEPFDAHGPLELEPYHMWDAEPAVIESSGTWLNRGIWYAEAEVVVLNRIWQRTDTMLAAADPNVLNPNFFPPFGLGRPNTNRVLWLRGSHPGQDASVRTTLGRFLFRDDNNRDHTAEFTAFGGGDWVHDCLLTSETQGGLFTPFTLSGGNRAFDGSSLQHALYSSRYNSFELNYRVKRRLGRDQMVMDPNGHWRREASNGFTRSYLAGLRYLKVRETLDWRAEDLLAVGENARYLINTDNDLIGVQFGAGVDYETGRWSLGLRAKGGFFVNDTDANSQLNFSADDDSDFNRHASEAELSFVGESGIVARWYVTPSFSLRAGWEVMLMESLAQAPKQINFIDGYSKLNTGGYSIYMGGSLGFEGYW